MKTTLLCIVIVSVVVSVAIAGKGCGKKYPDGSVFLDDDCNKCHCLDGLIICELMDGCITPGFCQFNKIKYNVGEVVHLEDCNKCECKEDGHLLCTNTCDY